jgi:DNA-binding transcriptional LysR family regulator
MDIRELRYFVAVFQERSLTAAAKRCFISQPSVSAAISSLEAELGTTLFIRHKKGVAPTASAEEFYEAARRIIDNTDAARNLFRKPSTRSTLTLGLMRTLDIPRTIALLKPVTANPGLHLRLVGSNETADARIVSKAMLRAGEHFVPLWTERYVAALPPSHPLILKDRIHASDLAGVAMIDRCHCEQSEFFRRTEGRQEPVAVAESEDWAMALVAAGVGVAIVPEGVARANPDVVIRDIADVDVTRLVGLAYSDEKAPSSALQALIATLTTPRSPSRRKTVARDAHSLDRSPA